MGSSRLHLLPLQVRVLGFPAQLLQKLNKRIQQNTRRPANQGENETWTTFTYHSQKIRAVTNLFKNTNIKIAFKTADTTQKIKKTKKIPL
jgi:hypothetical protein